MATSKTLSALIGPTLIIVAASMLLNINSLPALMEQASRDAALILLSGIITFVAGLAIIRVHNIWKGEWFVAVTILGWLLLLGGLIRVLLPFRFAALAAELAPNTRFMVGEAIVLLALGAFFSFKGYSRG